MSFGERLKYFRQRAGKSRRVLGGLVGKSEEWVKAVETGRLLPPRLQMLARIAEVLKIKDLSDLTGEQSMPVRLLTGPGHVALPAVRDAINSYPLSTDSPPQPLTHLRARLATAWKARHGSADHRTVLGGMLPDLIRDAQVAALSYEGRKRRQAQAVLAEVFGLAQMYLAYQPCAELLWRVADRAMVAAQESGDPMAIAGAVWFLCQVHRDAGDWDTATDITLDGIRTIEPRLAAGGTDLLALWGALQFEAAYTAARAGETGRAWRHWDEADRAATRLPADYYQPWTSFSQVIIGAHAVTVDVELRHGGEAIRHARRTDPAAIPSRPRRARHLIEVARGHHLRSDHKATVRTLRHAYDSAPETIRYNGYARQITLELVNGPAAVRREANELAEKVGLLT